MSNIPTSPNETPSRKRPRDKASGVSTGDILRAPSAWERGYLIPKEHQDALFEFYIRTKETPRETMRGSLEDLCKTLEGCRVTGMGSEKVVVAFTGCDVVYLINFAGLPDKKAGVVFDMSDTPGESRFVDVQAKFIHRNSRGKKVTVSVGISRKFPGDLIDFLKSNPDMPVQQLDRLLWEIIKAIKALQDQRIIHRDLKPENILVGKGKKVMVCDFSFCTKAVGANGIVPGNMGTMDWIMDAREGPMNGLLDQIYMLAEILWAVIEDNMPPDYCERRLSNEWCNDGARYPLFAAYKTTHPMFCNLIQEALQPTFKAEKRPSMDAILKAFLEDYERVHKEKLPEPKQSSGIGITFV